MTSNNRLSGKPARAAMVALLLCAVITTAQAQQPGDQERRQKMIEDCEQNFGSEVDCTREVDTELRAEALQSGARVIHLRPAR
jgi:cytochrome c556